MYRKAAGILALWGLVLLYGTICANGAMMDLRSAQTMEEKRNLNGENVIRASHSMGIMDKAISDQRVVGLQVVAQMRDEAGGQAALKNRDHSGERNVSDEDKDMLLRIVEAEAGNQDADGRLLVANVVLNRVESDRFPDSVKDVVLQEVNGTYQFSPVGNGRIWQINISDMTKEAVERALDGEDISDGALYFVARQYADAQKVKWFDDHLTYLFEWGGHEFFR